MRVVSRIGSGGSPDFAVFESSSTRKSGNHTRIYLPGSGVLGCRQPARQMTRPHTPENENDDKDDRPVERELLARAIEMVVERGEDRLKDADTLTAALRDLVVPQTFSTDLYDTGDAAAADASPEDGDDDRNDPFPFDSMIKFFLYKEVKNISDGRCLVKPPLPACGR